ncbi:MAG: arsenate reductase ArsC [Chloroflexi bacterium]|nr:arsenate reductase ArsC [Chloroflexota bacterium]
MKRILFIDLRNTVRSQMAEAWFNQFADVWAKAYSCGTMPAALIDPVAARVMSEAGLDMRAATPKPINNALLAQADIVVMMGKDVHPGAFTPDYIWDFQDPTGKDVIHYRIQRDAIRQQVQELIVELQRLRFDSTRSDWIHRALLQRELMMQQMLCS